MTKLLVALPGEGYFVVRVPKGEFRVQPGGLFVGEVFGANLQGPADPVERISFPAPMPERVLLDPAPDLIDHSRAKLHDMERIQDIPPSEQEALPDEGHVVAALTWTADDTESGLQPS